MRAYILRIDRPVSREYAECCARSCDEVGLPWEYFDGFDADDYKNDKGRLWNIVKKELQADKLSGTGGASGGACATAGHFMIWKRIADSDEPGIILEHDALMLHYPKIEIPDNQIVVLGYKVVDPENYHHHEAGAPKTLQTRAKHGGAHAYAITPKTAESLINTLRTTNKRVSFIDNQYFFGSHMRGGVSMSITDPVCAIGWLRKSTIWNKAAVDNYGPILESFRKNYHSKEDMGVKK